MESIKNLILYFYFVLRGKNTHKKGYYAYKKTMINRVLAKGDFNSNKLKSGYGFRVDERIIEYPWLLSKFSAEKTGRLLDAGSALNCGYMLKHTKLKDKQIFIYTLAPEKEAFWDNGISYVYSDLRNTCFKNDYFDWVVCLSTLEHIGFDNTIHYTQDETKKENMPQAYLDVIKELKRILKPGGVLYISVPFGKYVNHKWFQVFNAQMIDSLIREFAPSQYEEKYFRYYQEGWQISTRAISENSDYFDMYANIEGNPNSVVAAESVVCIEMTK